MCLLFDNTSKGGPMKQGKIDILMRGGSRGGFENIVNQTAVYLTQNGYHVRYVRLLASDVNWAAPEVTDTCLHLDQENVDLDEARMSYGRLLQKDTTFVPSLILATGWPYLIYVAKGAASDAGLQTPVLAWPHDDLQYYEEGGSGDISFFQYIKIIFTKNKK